MNIILRAKEGALVTAAIFSNVSMYVRQYTSSRASKDRRKMYMEWRKGGLIPNSIGQHISGLIQHDFNIYEGREHWGYHSLIELLWIRLVAELRHFNYPKELIKEFADKATTPSILVSSEERDKLLSLSPETLRLAYNLQDMGRNKHDEIGYKNYVKSIEHQTRKFSEFEILIHRAFNTRQSLIFYGTKEMGIQAYLPSDELDENSEYKLKKALSNSYIAISLLDLIDDFIWDGKGALIDDFKIIMPIERQVLQLIRSHELKEIRLHFDKEKKQIYKATLVSEEVVNAKHDERLFLEAIRSQKYKKMELIDIRNRHILFHREEVIKL